MENISFIRTAISEKVVFVDCDGTLFHSVAIPSDVPSKEKFAWWNEHVSEGTIVYSRLALCVFLWLVGVKLVIWTNRGEQHKGSTIRALGIARFIFSDFMFCNGKKAYSPDMVVIDDDVKYSGIRTLTVSKA